MSRGRALIAEDHPAWQRILAQVLETEYDVVAVVGNGKDVIETAVSGRVEVITLDVSLPEISGLRLLPALRRALPDAVILLVTTQESKLYREEAYQRGADGDLIKNQVADELLATLHAARKRTRERARSRA